MQWKNPMLHAPNPVVVVLFCLASRALSAENHSLAELTAVVTVASPSDLAESAPGYYATFSHLPPPASELVAWVPKDDVEGCQKDVPKVPPVPSKPFVAIFRRGSCLFVEKALHAAKLGAAGLIIVNSEESLDIMGAGNLTEEAKAVDIFVVGVFKSFGDKLVQHLETHRSTEPLTMTFSIYVAPLWNPSEAVLICMATSLVVAGAFFATADLRAGSPLAPRAHEEILDVNSEMAFSFCLSGSIMLMVLFFLMAYMIYVIIFCFCLGGFTCLTQIGSLCLTYSVPVTRKRILRVPELGKVSAADIMAAIPAASLILTWLVLRNSPDGWIFQDIIGAGFLCWMQRTLRLPNIKVATALLTTMFFFDIFWVFISPVIFQKSVMVEVAQGGGTGESLPMLLRIPSIGDPFGRERMLGFGDIALPGLLVSYLRRHDIQGKKSALQGFFVPSVIGYFIGLCVTIVALTIMNKGQPALLYLVPGTLGTTLLLAWARGELPALWTGTSAAEDAASARERAGPEVVETQTLTESGAAA